jgi:hypothetical protein
MTSRTAKARAKAQDYAERFEAAAMGLSGVSDLTIVSPGTLPELILKAMDGDRTAGIALSMLPQAVKNFAGGSRNLCGCCDYRFPAFTAPETIVIWTPKNPAASGGMALNFGLCPECAEPSVILERAAQAARRIQDDVRIISPASYHDDGGRA